MTNPQIQSEETLSRMHTVNAVNEAEVLAHQGFNEDEILSLLWLQQWYQHGGSDRKTRKPRFKIKRKYSLSIII